MIFEPSGDHGRPPSRYPSATRCRPLPSTGVTYTLQPQQPGARSLETSALPSGDHDRFTAPWPSSNLSDRGRSTLTAYVAACCAMTPLKAIHFPSGDQVGDDT